MLRAMGSPGLTNLRPCPGMDLRIGHVLRPRAFGSPPTLLVSSRGWSSLRVVFS